MPTICLANETMFIIELKGSYQIELKDRTKMHSTCIRNTFKVYIVYKVYIV